MRQVLIPAVLALMAGTSALAREAAPPIARVEGNAVVEATAPAHTVRVPAGATYVGSERFTLYGVADCEIHLFVEADADRQVRRLYWVQFEAYLPARPELRYDYGESDRRMDLWGGPVWMRAGFGPTAPPSRAGSDGERVRTMLARAGYTRPPHMMNVRLVRLLDDPRGTGYGRRELMLIYAEDLASTGLASDDLSTNGAPNARWAPLEQALVARATEAFRIERAD